MRDDTCCKYDDMRGRMNVEMWQNLNLAGSNLVKLKKEGTHAMGIYFFYHVNCKTSDQKSWMGIRPRKYKCFVIS